MIPPSVDLDVMGHIHLHQRIWGNVVYTGAPERIDWGERGDAKGFLALSPKTKSWEFGDLPARGMEREEATVHQEDEPTPPILGPPPKDVRDAMVRLDIPIPKTLRPP